MRRWGRIPKPLLKIYMAQLVSFYVVRSVFLSPLTTRPKLLGLQHLHAHDVYHRDIKPANLLVNTQTHELVIADFGVAITAEENVRRRAAMVEGQMDFVGTLEYMSREVWIDSEYSPASDIFAAGCVLFEGHLNRVSLNLSLGFLHSCSDSRDVSTCGREKTSRVSLSRVRTQLTATSTVGWAPTGTRWTRKFTLC